MKVRLKDTNKFSELLIMNGYTQRSLGKAINISQVYAHQIATGKRNPGPAIAKKIHEALNVEFDDIFFIETLTKVNTDN